MIFSGVLPHSAIQRPSKANLVGDKYYIHLNHQGKVLLLTTTPEKASIGIMKAVARADEDSTLLERAPIKKPRPVAEKHIATSWRYIIQNRM